MPRPLSDNPKTYTHFRATADEQATYKAAAVVTGKTLSAWIRETLARAAKRALRKRSES